MMSIVIKNIEVEVKGRFTSLSFIRGKVSYGFCHDVTYLRADSDLSIFMDSRYGVHQYVLPVFEILSERHE